MKCHFIFSDKDTYSVPCENVPVWISGHSWTAVQSDQDFTAPLESSTLGKIFSKQHFEFFFSFFPGNRI